MLAPTTVGEAVQISDAVDAAPRRSDEDVVDAQESSSSHDSTGNIADDGPFKIDVSGIALSRSKRESSSVTTTGVAVLDTEGAYNCGHPHCLLGLCGVFWLVIVIILITQPW